MRIWLNRLVMMGWMLAVPLLTVASIAQISVVPTVKQTASIYDASSIPVVYNNALTDSAASEQPLPSFGLISKLVAAKSVPTVADDAISLFHQGNLRGGQVSGTRYLSTSPSSDLLQYRPQGQLYEFQVPRSTLNQWLGEGSALRLNDLHAPSGIITPEIRILPPASGQMNQFLVPPATP